MIVQDSKSRRLDQYIVRLPDGLRDRIKAAADASGRSMNAEIVATLEERYPSPSEFDLPSFLDVHLKPITKARTSVERSKLFDAANRFLEENAPAIRVWLEIVDTDHAELYLYTGKTGMFIKRWKVSPETP